MEFIQSILSFVVAIGVLVTVHEFGHFWVARRLGVKVLRFSVGFGRPLWRHRSAVDDTEYWLAAVPLGGYVKMLDEREAEVPEEERHRAFNRQPLASRMAIVVAGPLFNFVFAILAYWLMFSLGVSGLRPLVDEVEADSMAEQAGLRAGQEIRSVDGEPTPTWDSVVQEVLAGTVDGRMVELVVQEPHGAERSVSLDLGTVHLDDLSQGGFFDRLGLSPRRPILRPVIDRVEEGSPAERAGLLAGDRVTGMDGQPVHTWSAWVEYVRAHPEQDVEVEVQREEVQLSLNLRPARVATEDGDIGRIGAAVRVPEDNTGEFYAVQRFAVAPAFGKAVGKTWEVSTLTLKMLWKMLKLEVSVKNLSGPITIAQYAGYSARIGISRFLQFLAIVSISLGVLNLLPIPLLDGGHLLYYLIELFSGKPVTEETQLKGQRIGIALLFGLMSLAFFNDLTRLLN